MSVFEVCMMICFGFAWPVNLYNSIKKKSAKDKNILFVFIIALAYIFGILHKIIYARDAVLIFYILNFLMVLADIIIYYINKIKKTDADNKK